MEQIMTLLNKIVVLLVSLTSMVSSPAIDPMSQQASIVYNQPMQQEIPVEVVIPVEETIIPVFEKKIKEPLVEPVVQQIETIPEPVITEPIIEPVLIQEPIIDPIITPVITPVVEQVIEPIIIMKKIITLELIDPIKSKGSQKPHYYASEEIVDETNYVELGLLIRDDKGESTKDLLVEITATDDTQNKTINGTGNVTNIYRNGVKEVVHYYPFHYQFKTAGKHEITFTADGVSEVLKFDVEDPAPKK